MLELRVSAAEHFTDVDYAGTEVAVYRWSAAAAEVLVCCIDLSEKIPHWAHGRPAPDYRLRYRVFRFHDVHGYDRTDVSEPWRTLRDDFSIRRSPLLLLVEDVIVHQTGDTHDVVLAFERGFGVARFRCGRATISELTLADAEAEAGFDEDAFLASLRGAG